MSWHLMVLVLSEVVCFQLKDKTKAPNTDLVVDLHAPDMNCTERTSVLFLFKPCAWLRWWSITAHWCALKLIVFIIKSFIYFIKSQMVCLKCILCGILYACVHSMMWISVFFLFWFSMCLCSTPLGAQLGPSLLQEHWCGNSHIYGWPECQWNIIVLKCFM